MELIHTGKVRDVYADGDDLILVASDRVSVYDVVLPTPVPDKGRVLTALSLWWFERLAGIVPNHVVSATDVPPQWRGRAIRVARLTMVPVECIARGYLTGLALPEYNARGRVSGVELPEGLVEADRLPRPVFTPTTKADEGHDLPLNDADAAALVGAERFEELRDLTLAIYSFGAELAATHGLILADTKLEFGEVDGRLVVIDEMMTPDSSRYWSSDDHVVGTSPPSFDKQYVRDHYLSIGWNMQPPVPHMPSAVIAGTRARYVEAYEQVSGRSFATWYGDDE